MDLSQLLKRMDQVSKATAGATVGAMNDAGFKGRVRWQGLLSSRFDRVTPYILRSIWVDRATLQKPRMRLYPRYPGGKGGEPEQVLYPHVFGGGRKLKRFERALQRTGLMASNLYAVPGSGAPLDTYGNVPGSFIVRLLSYFNTFQEQGYRANMTNRKRAKLANVGVSERGFKRIGGVVYFVSHGPGNRTTARGDKQQHLPAGIWSRTGIHGSTLKPVFLFVQTPSYRARVDFGQLNSEVQRDFVAAERARWDTEMRKILSGSLLGASR